MDDTNLIKESARIKARLLFDAVLAPIHELYKTNQLVVIPDGALNLVGFDSLIDRENRYLVRSHTISYAPSATVLIALRKRSLNIHARYSLLAFGAPALPIPTQETSADQAVNRALLDMKGGTITDLRAAGGEVREISAEIAGQSKVFIGPQATEAEFKQQPLRNFRVIHFAAHAFADLHYPERSAIVLAPDKSTRDDGLLQIREIRNLDLRADLVTLSTCSAGIGRVQGIEGIESLVNAFLFAGAGSVLASRWETDDTFAATLMAEVYRKLAIGSPIGDALRRAQLELLERYGDAARPAYWSAFFVSGAGNSTVHVQSPKSDNR